MSTANSIIFWITSSSGSSRKSRGRSALTTKESLDSESSARAQYLPQYQLKVKSQFSVSSPNAPAVQDASTLQRQASLPSSTDVEDVRTGLFKSFIPEKLLWQIYYSLAHGIRFLEPRNSISLNSSYLIILQRGTDPSISSSYCTSAGQNIIEMPLEDFPDFDSDLYPQGRICSITNLSKAEWNAPDSVPSTKSRIWQIGAFVMYLATGSFPVSKGEFPDTTRTHNFDLITRSTYSNQLAEAITKSLATDPWDRPDAALLEQTLREDIYKINRQVWAPLQLESNPVDLDDASGLRGGSGNSNSGDRPDWISQRRRALGIRSQAGITVSSSSRRPSRTAQNDQDEGNNEWQTSPNTNFQWPSSVRSSAASVVSSVRPESSISNQSARPSNSRREDRSSTSRRSSASTVRPPIERSGPQRLSDWQGNGPRRSASVAGSTSSQRTGSVAGSQYSTSSRHYPQNARSNAGSNVNPQMLPPAYSVVFGGGSTARQAEDRGLLERGPLFEDINNDGNSYFQGGGGGGGFNDEEFDQQLLDAGGLVLDAETLTGARDPRNKHIIDYTVNKWALYALEVGNPWEDYAWAMFPEGGIPSARTYVGPEGARFIDNCIQIRNMPQASAMRAQVRAAIEASSVGN
ncbi:MAG: hypothetical protein M1814_004505 [Vezdaea aestivalis]|nr:MAG: hypothetical protein M1814_004505 [Vezdaea aestivalis]